MIRVNEAISLEDREIQERFVRASGPGGQNVRKEATAVELRIDVPTSSLPPEVKDRLYALAGRHVTTDGVLVVVSRAHRSQAENRDAARTRLLALLRRAATPPKPRTPTRPRAATLEKRLELKKFRGAIKQSRAARVEN
jgi:ribosome-associated protein